jgi:PAS domain S-box-containing protein
MHALTSDFEALLDAVPDALVGVDRAGVIRFVNRQTESMFGYERDELVGAPLEVLVPESARPIHRVHRERYRIDPRTRPMGGDLLLKGRRRDGTQFPADIALSPMSTQDGVLVVAAVRDMTGYQRAEAARRRLDLLSAMVESSEEAIFASTPEGIITSWNPAAEQMYGHRGKEIIGRSVELLTPWDRTGEMTAILARIRASEHLAPFETMRVRKDGTVFAACLSVSPIHDIDGTVIGASTIAHDSAKQQHAFDAARSMIEASLDSLVAISPEGKITDANEATVRATGVPRTRLIGTCFSDYFTQPAKAEQIYQLVFAEGMALDYPLTLRHRDGTLTEVLYNASVYRDAGAKVLGVFAAARDVTKQVQARAEIAEQLAKEKLRLAELERFQRMTIDRALKVIELKKEIESLRGPGAAQAGESDDEW